MKTKILLTLCILTTVLFTGCGKKEVDTEPVVSETVEESEPTEPEEVIEPVEEADPAEAVVETEEIVAEAEPEKNTVLTKEELDQLKANATTDQAKKNIEIYESILNNGYYDFGDGGDPVTKVVGIPGDTSWRKLSDSEAQAVVAKGEMNKETFLAECELEGADFCRVDGRTGTVYFDPYAYREAMDQGPNETTINDIEWDSSVMVDK